MRTTLNTIYSKIQTNLGKITTGMGKINEQISSGQQMGKISEEPVNLVSALRFRSSVVELDQYTENIQSGNTMITAAESALTQMKELTLRAKTLAIQATDPAYTTVNREAIAEEIKNMFEQSVYLANTQVNGKYIFGGFRTTGYNETEPAPFIIDKGDGHWINGTTPAPLAASLTSGPVDSAASLLAALPPITGLSAGDLLIDGIDVGAVDLTTTGDSDGVNMQGAFNLMTAINTAVFPAVTATLTTQIHGIASAGTAVAGDSVDFTVNGVQVAYSVSAAAAGDAAKEAQQAVDAINAVSGDSGVMAMLGDGTNGAPANAVILRNVMAGDNSAITLAGLGLGPPDETATTGLVNVSQAADAANNSGQVSLTSSASISITSSATDDSILDLIGLGGGSLGNFDAAGDGQLVYGYPLSAGELRINGIPVPAPTTDGLSDIYADASAAAKAAAINSIQTDTGVTAVVINAEVKAVAAVTAGTEPSRATGLVTNTVVWANSLAINGTLLSTDIQSGAVTNGLNMVKAANAKTAINAEAQLTHVRGRLTTLLPSNIAAQRGTASTIAMQVNGIDVSVTTGGLSASDTANDVVAAINAVKGQTGVEARMGDTTNGGVDNAIVLFNSIKGNEDAIVLTGLDAAETALTGLGNINQGADAANNTGEISLDSDYPITLSSPNTTPGADIIINELGFSSSNAVGFGGHAAVTATVSGNSITAPDSLYVNGNVCGNIVGGLPTSGVNMDMAFSAKTQIEAADPNVQVRLTTMTRAAGPATNATVDSDISFKVNGEAVSVSYSGSASASEIAALTAQAINNVLGKTGVQAYVGNAAADGSPAGSALADVIVLKNVTAGNDAAITISEMTVNAGSNELGLTEFSQAADATHNSGQITISSNTSFDLSTPTANNDLLLNRLGLGDGVLAGFSEKDDGIFYATDGTGDGQVSFGASPNFMDSGDLSINGVDIFSIPTTIIRGDQSNALIDAINAQTAATGVQATHGTDGVILLTATDGRNIHLQTSINGEAVTHLTGGTRDRVVMGALQLRSDRKFILEDPSTNANEPGLSTLGLAGGEAVSGEAGDVAGDGKIEVFSIHERTGSVRYAGDRVNDLEIKIGKTTTMTIGENGKTGIMDTALFTTLRALQDYLLNDNFTSVTGFHAATDRGVALNSKLTGLEPDSQLPYEDLFKSGAFTVVVTDHDYNPPRTSALTIGVDPAVDTLDSVSKRIDGIPNVKASWTEDGKLKIESSDPARYTIAMTSDSSNFLQATGVSPEFMQNDGIFRSIDDLDTLMQNLTKQVSDFGARANRIDIQRQIFSTMTISTKENLSEVQDTDMIKAIMELKSKETAYQAALSAASKTMQLSLVDYLR